MNDDGTVNDLVTDSVSQLNSMLIGATPPESIGLLDIASSETIGMAMYNAVSAQQNSQISSSAAVTSACAKMLSTQPTLPSVPAPAVDNPPPFMPLGPDKADSASLIKEADTLANDAVEMLKESGQSQQDNEKEVTNLITKLQSYLNGLKSDKTATPPQKQENKNEDNNENKKAEDKNPPGGEGGKK
ncbi:MAG: RebB family R body protein [Kangiellaceae bacterium]|nr:RebB family R body protein [Kangiellaceae bacterium]